MGGGGTLRTLVAKTINSEMLCGHDVLHRIRYRSIVGSLCYFRTQSEQMVQHRLNLYGICLLLGYSVYVGEERTMVGHVRISGCYIRYGHSVA